MTSCHFLKNAAAIGLGMLFAAAPARAQRTQPDPRLLEQPTAPYTAEQILNGETPGRKPSPSVEVKYDDEGFAGHLLYHVPAPGIHPRVLFAPEDLPRIRRQLADTEIGKAQLAAKRHAVAATLDQPGTWENDCYLALLGGDVEKVRAAYAGPKSKIKPGPPGTTSNPLIGILQDKAFLALVDDDKETSRKVAKAAVTLVKFLEPEVDAAIANPEGADFWRVLKKVTGEGAAIGFLYDFTAPEMTDEQAAVMRGFIVKLTKGRYTLGMDLPPHWRNWNFIGLTLYFPLLTLSIEGEEGYDARIYARGAEVARDYILHAASADGVGKEGIGYHTAGMAHTTMFAFAMANRGDKILTLERYRRQVGRWLVWAMQPYGGEWTSSGDLGTFPPSAEFVQAMKFFYPQDPRVDYVFQNLPDLHNPAAGKPGLLQLLTPVDPSTADHHAGADFHFGDTLLDKERGYLFMRSGWGKEAAAMQFAARSDTTFASHDFADRGTFYFTADGYPWTLSGFRETEGKYSNTVAIDGRGQGYFATPAAWIGVEDQPLATVAAVDLKYCYDWRWIKPPMVYTPAEFAAKPRLKEYEEPQQRLYGHSGDLQWERDPSPRVIDYYSGYLAGDPGMWDEDSWVKRAPNYPVQHAFRTVAFVRGKHPYAMVVDDLQKDDQERLYEWHAVMPTETEVVAINGRDLILTAPSAKRVAAAAGHDRHRRLGVPVPSPGTPQLLVRILDVSQPASPTLQPNPALETIELLKHDDLHQNYLRSTGLAKRLVLPSRSVSPNYKVLLYPYKQGEPLPVTTWNAEKTGLAIEHDGVKDSYTLTKSDDGRTRLRLERADETVTGP